MFLPQGGQSPYLQHIAGVLCGIRDGVEFGTAMFAAFDSMELIQPVGLDVQLDDKHRVSVNGLYSIDREKLGALDAGSLQRLNQAGYLEGAYLVLASLHNVRRLMAEKQRRLREQDAATPERTA